MMGIDVSGRVIYMNTFSKTLTPTIRISYMVLPDKLVEVFHRELGFYSCTVSNFEQYTLARFIRGGYFEKHINRMRNCYRKRREALLHAMKAGGLFRHADLIERGSGLHFLLHFHTDKDDGALQQEFAQKGIRMRPCAITTSARPTARHTPSCSTTPAWRRAASKRPSPASSRASRRDRIDIYYAPDRDSIFSIYDDS